MWAWFAGLVGLFDVLCCFCLRFWCLFTLLIEDWLCCFALCTYLSVFVWLLVCVFFDFGCSWFDVGCLCCYVLIRYWLFSCLLLGFAMFGLLLFVLGLLAYTLILLGFWFGFANCLWLVCWLWLLCDLFWLIQTSLIICWPLFSLDAGWHGCCLLLWVCFVFYYWFGWLMLVLTLLCLFDFKGLCVGDLLICCLLCVSCFICGCACLFIFSLQGFYCSCRFCLFGVAVCVDFDLRVLSCCFSCRHVSYGVCLVLLDLIGLRCVFFCLFVCFGLFYNVNSNVVLI